MLCVGGLRTIPPRLFCVTTNWLPTILKNITMSSIFPLICLHFCDKLFIFATKMNNFVITH